MDNQPPLTLLSGNQIPPLGLGTWQLDQDTSDTVAQALNLGFRLIDTSSDYGTQPGIGEGIKQSGLEREEVFVVTKVEETDDAYERAKSNLEELQLDYVNLLLIHRPPQDGSAGESLWDGLRRAKQEGLTRDIGVSNYSIPQLQKIIDTGEAPVVNQIEWSPFGHSEAMRQFAMENDIVIMAYSSLTRTTKLDNEVVGRIANKYKKTPAQIMLRWNIDQGTIPLVKANESEHLQEDINVFDFSLSDEDISALNDLNENYSSLGKLPYV